MYDSVHIRLRLDIEFKPENFDKGGIELDMISTLSESAVCDQSNAIL